MRLFIAINLSDEMRSALIDAQNDMYESGVRGNFSPEENLHVTLAFIGEYPDPEEVREALEVLAVKLACRNMTQAQMEQIRTAADQFKESLGRGDLQASARADARFHEAICLATRNRRLIQLLNNIREQIFRYRLEYLKGRENYGKLAAEHERILTALAGKKEQEAADAAALHIANQRVSIMEQLRREKEEKR